MDLLAQVIQIRHVGIVVKDLERALWFYSELLGLEVQRRLVESGPCVENILALERVEVETVKLGTKDGGTQVELLSFRSHPIFVSAGVRTLNAGPTHIAFTVDDLNRLYADMGALGVEFNCPPQSSTDRKVLLTYCKDPDGTLIELVEIL